MEAVNPKELITVTDKPSGELHTYSIVTGELIYRDGSLTKDFDFAYTIPEGMKIAARVREGKTLKEIAASAESPSLHLIYAWRRNFPGFAQMLKEAKEDRAEYFHDKAVIIVEEAEEADTRLDKFRFDAYMKLAEKGNPQEFGKTGAEAGGGNVTIVVNTGIDRDPPVTIEVESKKVDEEDECVTLEEEI